MSNSVFAGTRRRQTVGSNRGRSEGGLMALLRKLHSIEIGGSKKPGVDSTKIRPAALSQLLRLLLMLLQNGLTLPRALQSLASDRSARRYRHVLDRMRRTIEAGGRLSEGMACFPKSFSSMQVQQIRIGENSGSLETTLEQVCEQLENRVALRKRIVKKVSYPILITIAGIGLTIFMCTFVVPEFEGVYSTSGVDLPPVTRVVTGVSRALMAWGWLVLPIGGLAGLLWAIGRSRPRVSRQMDRTLLRLPVVGPWLRDAAVLQFVDATSAMIQCGYTPVESVEMAAACVRNRDVRSSVEEVCRSVNRGEKLSVELSRHEKYFPPTLCQLVAVGEQSGEFGKALRGTAKHLRERLESRIDASVGLLEPTLTIGLAILIGGIVLSIYTPMFHMFEVLE
ncbi:MULTISPECIES: type II secretion system F family protein [Crateriforma]|uniref:Type II secretion system protein F n=1 Tax=Crateriforma conspicua TaxID=2527996 RepID=A0A5C6FPW7_9PLAN|nr:MULTISPECIES: type II secretion system F family protein [Crateriforma]TWU63449.1 Type II secretion system protein F [Crateriforma conspicua]